MASFQIRRINKIKKLNVFSNYSRDTNVPDLRQLNLIYGFNGTGKTSLSYLFQTLANGVIYKKLSDNPEFEVELYDGTFLKSNGSFDALKNRILVFNEDFVEENLSWKAGTAKPVFFIGREQAEAVKKLEGKQGDHFLAKAKFEQATKEFEQSEKLFSILKRDSARVIAEALGLGRSYDATHLAKDYSNEDLSQDDILDEPQKQSLKSTISQQSPLPKRNELNFSEYQIGALVEKGRELLETSLGQSVIEALKEHESMLIWVKEGFEYHTKEGLTDCLLCGNQIDELRKDLLTKFLDGKMDALLNDVDDMRPACDDKMARINMLSGMIPSENDIIDSQRQSFNEKSIRIKSVLSDMAKAIGQLNELLEDKLNKPTQRLSTESFLSNSLSKACDDEIESLVKDLNEIIKIHNKSHDDFKSLQNSARDKLKKHFLSSDQNAYLEQQKLTEATELAKNTELEVAMNLGVEVERLKQEVRRHGPAAEKMNGLIHNYLGHKELNISTHKEGYELHRNGKLVTGSLSEGEKTAIALCYFLCTLEADNKKIKDLIIVVDDPISSLDTKALNYAFSMLKSFLGKAGQLIILTHNLNFMNEVKKWLKNKTEGSLEDPSKATATLLFLEPVRNAKERASEIKILPKLLREYESEYHYLFHTVLKYARDPNAHEGWVMLIPNAMRKVLDVFLAFKFPGSSGFAGKIEQALSTVPEADSHRVRAIERLVQSESHADNLDDLLTFSTMTIEETEAASKAVLELLKMMDEGHYAQLAKICA